jgi:4-hydroxy-2-oxoheptanedioate aldolase
MGIIIPHLNSAEEARAAVAATRYGPRGGRSAGSMTWVADFGLARSATEYFERADREIFVWAIVEELRAVSDLDRILAVEGLEVVGVGPGDLAMSMGFPGQPDHSDVRRAVEDIERRVVSSGKILMSLVSSPEQNRGAVERGARLIVTSATPLFAAACRQFLGDLKAAATPKRAAS